MKWLVISAISLFFAVPALAPDSEKQPEQSSLLLEILVSGFKVEPLYSFEDDIVIGEGNNIVAGANDDAIVAVARLSARRDYLVWYSKNGTRDIARPASRAAIYGITPAGPNALLVVIEDHRMALSIVTHIYKLTGPFRPAAIEEFAAH